MAGKGMMVRGGAIVSLAVLLLAGNASAQTTIQPGHISVWGSIGFAGDLGGSVNSSGIGVVNGVRAEINANTWGERYDSALVVRSGVAYNLTDRSQVFGAVTWDQGEADVATVGLIGGQPLDAKFGDYQGWGIDIGFRRLFLRPSGPVPFVAASLGFERLDGISITLTSPTGFQATEVPFYDDSWVTTWRAGGGILWDFHPHFGVQVSLDIKYGGVLSDAAGIGTIGFERINDAGNRWSWPLLAGIYVKF